jgi:hypothetical protein
VAQKLLGNDLPFGGLQVIVCADFGQLPPVPDWVRQGERLTRPDVPFAFEAEAWQAAEFIPVSSLKKIDMA